ncbi:MAG: delta-60 repeat domain-containing protein, partial [Vicinamibacterales bacterium]
MADAGNAYDSANAVAVQSDGKIVVAGFGDTFTVIRYNTDGTVDSTFTPPASLAGGSNEFDAITILSDGKILLAGDGYNAAAGEWDIRVTRLNSNGTYDSSFGNLGTRYVDIGGSETAFDMALQTDGKIVLTGQTFGTSWNAFTARLSANGSIDTTFAGTGYVVTDFGTTNQEWANALVIQTDGKILIGGTSDDGSKDHMAMARFNTNGTYDTSFIGGTGIYVFPVVSTFGGESIKDMVLLPDGKILTGGVGGAIDFMIARFNTNGSLDTSFATSGRKTLNVGPSNDRIETLAVRSDGRIIAGGWRYSSSTGNYDWALVEFLSDGTPASDFGTGGIVTTDFGTNWDQGNALVQTSSGIVMAGTAGSANVNGNFALARYADTPIYGSITGTIFNDDNNNAVQDGSEGPFGTAGTAFIDANNNGAYDTGEPLGTTAAAGNFRFASLLPGTYAIRMRFTSPVNTYTVTTPALNVTLVEGQNMTNAGPIGVYTVYAVGGQAFADFDQDGVLDSDETLLTGRTIYVDSNDNGSLDNGEQSGVTDSKGAWTLKLPKGTYRLRQVVPGNWQETGRSTSVAVSGSTFAADGAVRVPTDSVSNLLRFGSQSVTLSRVAGFVVRDTNGNGVKDTGEATLTPGDVVYIDANN